MEELRTARPSGPLRRHVASVTGYRSVGVAPAVHRGLPSPWLTVVLALDDPLEVVVHPDPGQPGGRFDALVGGLHVRPALIAHPGRQSGLQLAVDPLGARALLGVPAGELAGRDLHAEDLLGPEVRLLRERLLAAPDWGQRFAVLEHVLAARLRDVDGPAPEVRRAWAVLLASGGAVRVDALAREVGWSTRHLAVRFRQEVGLTPKQAARVVRFDRARRALQARPSTGLAGLAAASGYYDQAHLAREFRELAGLPPSGWLAAEGLDGGEVASVQDGGALPAAG